jgi:hypothetical protein
MYSRQRERAFKCQHNFIRRRGTLYNNIINTSEKLYEVRKQIFSYKYVQHIGYEVRPGPKVDVFLTCTDRC